MNEVPKIPKIIHYIWVGPQPMSKLAQKCITSWKQYLPEYEFRFWNEENSPMGHHYVQEMYAQGKWAFVSDYIRFWALEKYGGIYLDTDTEVLKSFDDLLHHNAFVGETKDGTTATGVIGATPQHSVIRAMLEVYDNNDTYSTKNTSPRIVTSVLNAGNYPDVAVYDYRYFNPCDDGERCMQDKLSLAYARNHWAESWVPYRRARKLARHLGFMKFLKFLRKPSWENVEK